MRAIDEQKEGTLEPHDLCVPLWPRHHPSTTTTATVFTPSDTTSPRTRRDLRLLLLTPADLAPPHTTTTTRARLVRFASLTGGVDCAVVLLLSPTSGGANGSGGNLHALAALQTLLLSLSNSDDAGGTPALAAQPPILLLRGTTGAAGLAALVTRHVALSTSARARSDTSTLTSMLPGERAARGLLPFCTVGPRRPMSEHAALVLSEAFCGLAELGGDCWGGGRRVRAALEGQVGRDEVEGVVAFWTEEWVLD